MSLLYIITVIKTNNLLKLYLVSDMSNSSYKQMEQFVLVRDIKMNLGPRCKCHLCKKCKATDQVVQCAF